jgi:hypothetical protein
LISFQALRFGRAGAPAGSCDAEVARPPAAGLGILRRIDLYDETGVDEPVQIPVQHGGPQPHVPGRPFEDVVHHAEAVQVTIRKRQQDLEHVRRKRLVFGSRRHGAKYIPIGINKRELFAGSW